MLKILNVIDGIKMEHKKSKKSIKKSKKILFSKKDLIIFTFCIKSPSNYYLNIKNNYGKFSFKCRSKNERRRS